MSASRALFDREHRAVRELLPFHANGTLSELEQARLTRHFVQCASCRDAAEREQWLAQLMQARIGQSADAAAAWSRIAPRLDAAPPAGRERRWLVWTAGWAAAASLAVLTLLIARQEPSEPARSAAYRTTLSVNPPVLPVGGQALRVVFSPQATEASIRELLARAHCEIVSGPTPQGVYTLVAYGSAADRASTALDALRASPLVVFGEPLQP